MSNTSLFSTPIEEKTYLKGLFNFNNDLELVKASQNLSDNIVVPQPESTSGVDNKPKVENANNDPLPTKNTEVIKRRFIRLALGAAAAMQVMRVGGFLLEHGAAFYAYAQYSPKTLWGQYFYANATHEAAAKILSTTLFGFSISSVMTTALAVSVGVIVAKGGAAIYNLCVDKEQKISITLVEMVSGIFSFVFRDTLF